MNNTEKRMQELKPSGLSGTEKERIWKAMETQLSTQKTSPVLDGFPTFKTFRRVSVPLVVALGLILGGGATVYAHEAALPGDLLFPVKIHVEKAQIFLAQNSAKKDELRIKFSEKRLNEVRTLVAISPSAVINTGASTTATTSVSGTGTSSVQSKKTIRTERAIAEALKELEETKASLTLSGSGSGVLILEDIIDELNGVGNGTVTITKISMNGGKKHDNNVKVHATITSTSTGTTTANTVTRVKFEDKKQGAKIEIKTNILSGLFGQGDKREDGHGSENDHGDDSDNEDADENDRDAKKDDHNQDGEHNDDKKIPLCHKTEERTFTISVSVHSARAHISHGDRLGACSGESQGGTDTTAPTISGIVAASALGTTTISFVTNEPATSIVYVGTTNPLVIVTAATVALPTATTTHSAVFSGLATSTTHYYVIVAKDLSANTTTSSQGNFLTN